MVTRSDGEIMDDAFTQQFLAFIKPFNSELPDHDPNNFYLEREWRRFGNLRFQPSEVSSILVASNYVHRLRNDRRSYSDKVVAAPQW